MGNALLVRRLKDHVRTLSQEIGNRDLLQISQLRRAAAYITQQFRESGYTVDAQLFEAQGQRVANLIATRRGTRDPEETILVGAHYDTCLNPGADDNASGIAGLLELARLLANEPTARTVRFVAFTNEELPFFQTDTMGSLVYARAAKTRNERLRATLILEMLGYYTDRPNSQQYPPLLGFFYPNRGNFIGVVGNRRNRSLVEEVVRSFKAHSAFPVESASLPEFIEGVDWSDQWSFWKEGYPAVMITDTAFLRNPHYHQESDTWETLDYERMAAVVEGLHGVVKDLAADQ